MNRADEMFMFYGRQVRPRAGSRSHVSFAASKCCYVTETRALLNSSDSRPQELHRGEH